MDVTDVIPNEALCAEGGQLIEAAVVLVKPDRVPIIHQGEAFSPHFFGMPTACCSNEDAARGEAHIGTLELLDGCDALNSTVSGRISLPLSPTWLTRAMVPGALRRRPRARKMRRKEAG